MTKQSFSSTDKKLYFTKKYLKENAFELIIGTIMSLVIGYTIGYLYKPEFGIVAALISFIIHLLDKIWQFCKYLKSKTEPKNPL